jgi:subtilisin family serine protease
LDLVKLPPLMRLTSGRQEIIVGLLDGPVASDNRELRGATLRAVPGGPPGFCSQAGSAACAHGTFVAGILCATRGSTAPGICPGCTIMSRPIFNDQGEALGVPTATPAEVAAAIGECIAAGARVINLSVALVHPANGRERLLEDVLDYAMRRGVLVVAAAGNSGTLESSAITRHPWVIPVAACDLTGRPIGPTNLGSSVGRRGLLAPGKDVYSVGFGGAPMTSSGTSAAAPFVTGAIALLWSVWPRASAANVKMAITGAPTQRRASVVPPRLDASAAQRFMSTTQVNGVRH